MIADRAQQSCKYFSQTVDETDRRTMEKNNEELATIILRSATSGKLLRSVCVQSRPRLVFFTCSEDCLLLIFNRRPLEDLASTLIKPHCVFCNLVAIVNVLSRGKVAPRSQAVLDLN